MFFRLHGDKTIIGIILTPSALAVYYIALRFYYPLLNLLEALRSPIIPRISESKNNPDKLKRIFHLSSRLFSLTIIPLGVFISILSYPIISIYTNEKYIEAWPILASLSILFCIQAYWVLFSTFLYILVKYIFSI